MDNKNIFTLPISKEVTDRINKLTPDSKAVWGKMTVDQVLAHCNVTYELIYTDKHKKPNGFAKTMLKLFVKKAVVTAKPYKKNGPTAPSFKITDKRVFETEKKVLIDNIVKTQELGEAHFEGKESHSFGTLNKNEWNNMLYKHLDHHLNQFGV